MARTDPDVMPQIQERLTEPELEDYLALAALDAELDRRLETANEGVKARLDEQLQEAKHTTGGRGYEFGAIVDRGHTTRLMGSSAVTQAFGMGQRPYGMPFMGTRAAYGNPYIQRASVRY